jgi:hypothetical protein
MSETSFWSHFAVLLKSDLDVLLNKSSCLATALGLTKLTRITAMKVLTKSYAALVRQFKIDAEQTHLSR